MGIHILSYTEVWWYQCTISGTVNFNAFHGCLKCTIVGERSNDLHVNVYPVAEAPKRTDEGFRYRLYGYQVHIQIAKKWQALKSLR